MGNHLTKCCCLGTSIQPLESGTRIDQPLPYQPLESEQREKLEEFFQIIISNASVDFTNKEIQDIQNAVSIMLEKIRTRVNSRGIFKIDRIVPSGSMSEKSSLWKGRRDHYLELDFLAVLINSIKECEMKRSVLSCEGCIAIDKPPVEYEILRQYYNIDEFTAESLKNRLVINILFMNEINRCLTSSCDCLSLKCNNKNSGYGYCTISLRPSSVEHKHGCGDCTVDMPTGTLHVNTDTNIDQSSRGPNSCSLIFQWNSKTMALSAPDRWLLQTTCVPSLPIYIDFLPALEYLKPTSPDRCCCIWGTSPCAEEKHDFFIVPKSCNVHDPNRAWDFLIYMYGHVAEIKYIWRKSWCMAEIHAITNKVSHKHRRCYQIMKYLSENSAHEIPNYDIKTVVLHHHTTCSDTTDICVDCVMRIYRDLLQAYTKKELLSYQSNLNIYYKSKSKEGPFLMKDRCKKQIDKLCSVSITDTRNTFVRNMQISYMES